MRTARWIFVMGLGLCCGLGHTQTAAGPKGAGDIAVVVNSINPATNLSLGDLRRILMGERRFWGGNVQVRLALREHGARERDQVLSTVLKMDDKAFAEHWRAKVFRGEASEEPLTLSSSATAFQYVKETPGGLSFVAAKNIPADLKVLRVDGKLPGEAGYALK
jgi:ABC-type phosphate transport system substrate-binding protein